MLAANYGSENYGITDTHYSISLLGWVGLQASSEQD